MWEIILSSELLAHPAFRPKMSLCHRVASVVCCLSSVHNSQEMLLLPQFLSDFNSKELGPVHQTASRISEILIIN